MKLLVKSRGFPWSGSKPSAIAAFCRAAAASSNDENVPMHLDFRSIGTKACQRCMRRFQVTPAAPVVLFAESLQLRWQVRSEEHTSELQSLMRLSYAVFC